MSVMCGISVYVHVYVCECTYTYRGTCVCVHMFVYVHMFSMCQCVHIRTGWDMSLYNWHTFGLQHSQGSMMRLRHIAQLSTTISRVWE